MKALFGCVFLALTLTATCAAQAHGGSGRTPANNVTISPLPGVSPTVTLPTVFLSGKVVLDDGTELTEPVAVQTICGGTRHTETFSDRHGSFSFQLGDPNPSGGDFADASNPMMSRGQSALQQRNWQGCQVQAVLPGFASEVIELASRMTSLESTDIGRVGLHRLAHVEGTSISVTSALAPDNARKALEKGREQEKKGKWDQALQSLGKAVQIYPKYAVAWFELGRVQLQKNDQASARHSFEQSVAADPKYVNPYNGLAEVAYVAGQWPRVVEITNKLLALNPVNFPGAYLFNGIANYYLQNFDAGETSARRGMKVDESHQFPKLQYLLGMILIGKHDYQQATEQMKMYLHFAREPADIQAAQ